MNLTQQRGQIMSDTLSFFCPADCPGDFPAQTPRELFFRSQKSRAASGVEEMTSNAGILVVTDMHSLPDSVEQWANKTFEDKLSGGAGLRILTNIQKVGKAFLLFLFFPFPELRKFNSISPAFRSHDTHLLSDCLAY